MCVVCHNLLCQMLSSMCKRLSKIIFPINLCMLYSVVLSLGSASALQLGMQLPFAVAG